MGLSPRVRGNRPEVRMALEELLKSLVRRCGTSDLSPRDLKAGLDAYALLALEDGRPPEILFTKAT